MESAKKQLEKYGWKEGEGLGKTKSGISKALRVPLKFDKGGLGYNEYQNENNMWWKKLYDDFANNIIVNKNSNNDVFLKTSDSSLEKNRKRKRSCFKSEALENTNYKNFVKMSELHQLVEKKIDKKETDFEAESKKMYRNDCNSLSEITDEELFNICKGRTAHKGARLGLKMNAKLERLKEQEKLYEMKLNNESEKSIK